MTRATAPDWPAPSQAAAPRFAFAPSAAAATRGDVREGSRGAAAARSVFCAAAARGVFCAAAARRAFRGVSAFEKKPISASSALLRAMFSVRRVS